MKMLKPFSSTVVYKIAQRISLTNQGSFCFLNGALRNKFHNNFLLQPVISGAKDEGYNLKYNNKRIDSKWNQLS
jgi:hypothetical protein